MDEIETLKEGFLEGFMERGRKSRETTVTWQKFIGGEGRFAVVLAFPEESVVHAPMRF
jgi:hypothetical protein